VRFIRQGLLTAAVSAFAMSSASASVVGWTDWNAAGFGLVTGEISTASGTVEVTTGSAEGYYGVQLGDGNGDTVNYFSPDAPYLSADVENAPPAAELIQLGAGGTVNILFSVPVQDPLFALVSWNGNTVVFDHPIEFLSYGRGYWGDGTPVINSDGNGFFGQGEVHGVLRVPGVFTSISFTHTSENWHGFTVGIFGAADQPEPPSPVPEPTSLVLMLSGLLGLQIARRRRT
jgi:hypothetical protein